MRSIELACDRSPRLQRRRRRAGSRSSSSTCGDEPDRRRRADRRPRLGRLRPARHLPRDRPRRHRRCAAATPRRGTAHRPRASPATRRFAATRAASELVIGCNDYPMIWDKEASEPERRAQLEEAIRDYDHDAFAPFTPREVALSPRSATSSASPGRSRRSCYEPPVDRGRRADRGAGARRLRRARRRHDPARGPGGRRPVPRTRATSWSATPATRRRSTTTGASPRSRSGGSCVRRSAAEPPQQIGSGA